MKKGLLFLIGLLVLSACSANSITKPKPSLEIQDEKTRELLWDFSIKTFEALKQEKNTFYSPMSLYFALDMLKEGAREEGLEELEELMGRDISEGLIDYLSLESEGSQSIIANSLWVHKDYTIKKDFKETLDKKHQAEVHRLDLGQQASMNRIAKWIKEKTRDRIDPELSVLEDAKLFLVNALYLKSPWQNPFMDGNTSRDIFYAGDQELEVDFMKGSDDKELYYENDNYQMARKSLEDEMEVLFIKPKNLKPHSLDYRELLNKRSELTAHRINWSIPKLHLQDEMELNETLKSLGVKTIFEADGKLGGISDDMLTVSLIKQWSDLLMDEEGIEAAAATMIGIRATAMPIQYPEVEMKLNSPYSLIISYKDIPLFIGTVYKPS